MMVIIEPDKFDEVNCRLTADAVLSAQDYTGVERPFDNVPQLIKETDSADVVHVDISHGQRTRRFTLIRNNNVVSPGLHARLAAPLFGKSSSCLVYNGHDSSLGQRIAADLCGGRLSGALFTPTGIYAFEQTDTSNPQLTFSPVSPSSSTCDVVSVVFHKAGHSGFVSDGTDTRRSRTKRALGDRPEYYSKYVTWERERVVELILVNDVSMVAKYENNRQTVIEHSIQVANYVNAIYNPLNIRVVLVDVVVWEQDEIQVLADSSRTLDNFMNYRERRLYPQKPHDNAHLLTNVVFNDGVIGKAHKQSMCTISHSGGVNYDRSHHAVSVGSTIAHEMGHNFGMEHDSSNCKCAAEHCVMEPLTGTLSPTVWSVCSLEYLQESFKQNMDSCLLNEPAQAYGAPVCGNGITEKGEQCDCGTVESCENLCCDASTCKFRGEAQCATGPCCDSNTCTYKSPGTLCRSELDECDLPEYCDGESVTCPSDVHKQDGQECHVEVPVVDKDKQKTDTAVYAKSHCSAGKCGNRDSQCQLLWGQTGANSPDVCYGQNTKRNPDIHGNCGYDGRNYLPCSEHNAKCGRLHCLHSNEKPEFAPSALKEYTYSYFTISNTQITQCRVARFDLPNDPGMVPDGAGCGINKMCDNATCTPTAYVLARRPCDSDCGGPERGVCNSLGNCHCFHCYGGSDCSGSGYGGSLDSGPACSGPAVSVGVIILIIILLMIPVLVFIYCYRKRNGKSVPNFGGFLSGIVGAAKGGKKKKKGTTSVQRDYIGTKRPAVPGALPAQASPGKTSNDAMSVNVDKPNFLGKQNEHRSVSSTFFVASQRGSRKKFSLTTSVNANGYIHSPTKTSNNNNTNSRYVSPPVPVIDTTVTYKPNHGGGLLKSAQPVATVSAADKPGWSSVDLTSPAVEIQPARTAPAPPPGVDRNRAQTVPPNVITQLSNEAAMARNGSSSGISHSGSTSSASTLQRQPSVRPSVPPPSRPERPRESVMERLYNEKGDEIGITASASGDGFADEVLGAINESTPTSPFNTLPHKSSSSSAFDSRAASRSRDNSVTRSGRRPNKLPPPPPSSKPSAGKLALKPNVSHKPDVMSQSMMEGEDYYDVITTPSSPKAKQLPPISKPVALKPSASPPTKQKPVLPGKPKPTTAAATVKKPMPPPMKPKVEEKSLDAPVKVSDIKARFEGR